MNVNNSGEATKSTGVGRWARGTILRLETASVDQVECQVEYQVEHQVDRSFLHFGPSLTFLDLTLQSASLTDFDITQP